MSVSSIIGKAISESSNLTAGNNLPAEFTKVIAILAAFFLILFVLAVILYVYTSFAFMAIAKRAKYSHPGIAWIPGVGPLIVTNRISGMHWWPFLLFIGCVIPFISGFFSIAIWVFSIIWLWKTFEELKRPGWWAIVPPITTVLGMILVLIGIFLLPIMFVGFGIILIGMILHLVFIGIAAWSR